MKKIFKKIILVLCLFLITNNYIVLAATAPEFQKAIASYCWNFYKNNGKDTVYDYGEAGLGVNSGHGENYAREEAYKGNRLMGTGHNSKREVTRTVNAPDTAYFFDCVGWVSFAMHNCIGLGEDTFTYFAVPTSFNSATGNGFENVGVSDLKPGDILRSSGHVMIYVGDIDNSGKGSIIHCTGHGKEGGPANGYGGNWGLICEYYDSSTWKSQVQSVARITDQTLNSLDSSKFDLNGNAVSSSKKSASGSKYAISMADFYYNGIPNGKYSVTKGVLERIIEAIAEIFEFLVTLIVNILRMVFVGWTAIFENLVTSAVKSVAGEDIEIISSTDVGIDSGDNVTVEKIVFNQISVFDVNFFNYNEENEENSEIDQINEDALRKE